MHVPLYEMQVHRCSHLRKVIPSGLSQAGVRHAAKDPRGAAKLFLCSMQNFARPT